MGPQSRWPPDPLPGQVSVSWSFPEPVSTATSHLSPPSNQPSVWLPRGALVVLTLSWNEGWGRALLGCLFLGGAGHVVQFMDVQFVTV